MGPNHSLVHLKLHIGGGSEIKKLTFTWNVSYLKDEIIDKLGEKWEGLPRDIFFFHKMMIVSRCYRQMCKQQTKVNKKLDLGTMSL